MAVFQMKFESDPIHNDSELMNLILSSPDIGTVVKIDTNGAFTHTYVVDEQQVKITYYDDLYAIWNGSIFDIFGASYAELEKMYKKFQTWSLKWFREEIKNASIYFDSYIGHGTTNINADTVCTNRAFTLTKDSGELVMNENGVIALPSYYSQFKINLDLSFPTYQNNTTLGNFTITAITVDQQNNTGTITSTKTIDHTIPKSSVSFSFDLSGIKSVKFVFSADKAETAWNIAAKVSVTSYITRNENEDEGE